MVDSSRVVGTFNSVVELQTHSLDAVFHALGDGTRRHMLRELAHGERTVGELAEPFTMSLAAASKHVKALEAAGLLRREVRGRTHVCHLEPGPLASAQEWLRFYERFWTDRLDLLEGLLRGAPVQPATRRRNPKTTSPTKPSKKGRPS
jgi:DNA-binding transcriptional ArsR family regulator